MGKAGRTRRDKRKKTSSSGDEAGLLKKTHRSRGPSGGSGAESPENTECDDGSNSGTDTVNVSDILSRTNNILFNESAVFDDLLPASPVANNMASNMASNADNQPKQTPDISPTNADIFAYLQRIDAKLGNVEKKLEKLDKLEEKVNKFESEVTKLWNRVGNVDKDLNSKVSKLDDRIDTMEMSDGQQQSKIDQLEAENTKLRDSISYLQSQSMRNNLIFCNIPEIPNEKPSDTETIVRRFITEKLKVAQDQVDAMKIERAHRMGPPRQNRGGSDRNIVCKFNLFKDREAVRQKRFELKGSRQFVHEQFPPEVVAKRQRLMPHLRKAKSDNKAAWISYDTLYVDGKAVKID